MSRFYAFLMLWLFVVCGVILNDKCMKSIEVSIMNIQKIDGKLQFDIDLTILRLEVYQEEW